jgi:thymidine phosphorylase
VEGPRGDTSRKIGDAIEEGYPLFTIFAERGNNLQRALDRLEGLRVVGVGD